jgi:Na+-transporting NADH:ubiquinone oxidoreductase subunit C
MSDTTQNAPKRSRDSMINTLIVAVGVSLFCSVLVSATAVILKPQQIRNQELYRQKIVLEVAGLYDPEKDIEALFAKVDSRLVDLEGGHYVDDIDVDSFDPLSASKDPALGVEIPSTLDIAGIRRRARYAPVFLVREGDDITQIILPVYGSGLWSTMYGYLSLDPDGKTIRGLRFYEHAETPGLGDQIDKPEWRARWHGKQLWGDDGQVRIEVIRGQVLPGDDAIYQVDGLAGATLTGRGVTYLLQYWMGPHGFGTYLARFAQESPNDG